MGAEKALSSIAGTAVEAASAVHGTTKTAAELTHLGAKVVEGTKDNVGAATDLTAATMNAATGAIDEKGSAVLEEGLTLTTAGLAVLGSLTGTMGEKLKKKKAENELTSEIVKILNQRGEMLEKAKNDKLIGESEINASRLKTKLQKALLEEENKQNQNRVKQERLNRDKKMRQDMRDAGGLFGGRTRLGAGEQGIRIRDAYAAAKAREIDESIASYGGGKRKKSKRKSKRRKSTKRRRKSSKKRRYTRKRRK